MPIAFDAATDGGNASGTTHIFSHTCTGSDRVLIVMVNQAHGTDALTGVTYGGVAMTNVITDTRNGEYAYGFILVNPASGANNVVISYSLSRPSYAVAASYTGADQTSQPDVNNSSADSDVGDFQVKAITVAKNDSWVIWALWAGGRTITANTNLTERVDNGGVAPSNNLAIGDSNAAVAPRSYSQRYNFSGNASPVNMQIAIDPVVVSIPVKPLVISQAVPRASLF